MVMEKKKSYSRPKPPLGPYTKPHVCVVKLDPEQALLTQCDTSGIWMDGAHTRCIPGNRVGGIVNCALSVRGHDTGNQTAAPVGAERPS